MNRRRVTLEHYTIAEEKLGRLSAAADPGWLSRTCEALFAEYPVAYKMPGTTLVATDEDLFDPEEMELRENLLGVVFVSCQVAIDHVAARVCEVVEYCLRVDWPVGEDLRDVVEALQSKKGIGRAKSAVRGLGERIAPTLTEAEFVHAVANCYKHRGDGTLHDSTRETLQIAGVALDGRMLISAAERLHAGPLGSTLEWASHVCGLAHRGVMLLADLSEPASL